MNAQIIRKPTCTIPLEEQKEIFESHTKDAVHTLVKWLSDPSVQKELIELARKRHHSGYAQYLDTMYRWEPEWRERNVKEELADAIVYLTSGSV